MRSSEKVAFIIPTMREAQCLPRLLQRLRAVLADSAIVWRVRSVREIPFTFHRRVAGSSKASLRIGWDYVQLLAQLYRAHRHAGGLAGAPAD